MEINNLLAAWASGLAVGYFDLLMLWSTSGNVLQGRNSRVYRFVMVSLTARLLLVGALFYLFVAVLHIGVVGFLLGLVMSLAVAAVLMAGCYQKIMGKRYVGNS